MSRKHAQNSGSVFIAVANARPRAAVISIIFRPSTEADLHQPMWTTNGAEMEDRRLVGSAWAFWS